MSFRAKLEIAVSGSRVIETYHSPTRKGEILVLLGFEDKKVVINLTDSDTLDNLIEKLVELQSQVKGRDQWPRKAG